MRLSSSDMLKRLGNGESIDQVSSAAGLDRAQFDAWWQEEIRARVPRGDGTRRGGVQMTARIERDTWGIPHIYADNDPDLFFGFGYAMAQDRLFQMDYLRRRGSGRLSEVLGAEGTELNLLKRVAGFRSVFELDLLARTVGLRRIAEAEWTKLPEEIRALLTAFSSGINAYIDDCRDRLPIEFDLLAYRPEPWSPIDSLTVEGEFRWYLTGRFPVIVMPELARRILGDGPLYRAFLHVEDDEESILPPGSYPSAPRGAQPVGVAVSEPQSGEGSNNWVLAGKRTTTGRPILASDPHIAFDAVSCWYEAHLCGGSFNVTGVAYTGMPGMVLGRNERVAWGITNNICSQRDLYQEKTDSAHPNCFLYDGRWEPARTREEVIQVKGGPAVRKTIRFSRNGPIVDEVLPPLARKTGTVALKWLGAYEGGWLTALVNMNRARSAAEFREALRPWHVPTFCVVFADVDGKIGYQATGRVPIRKIWERGYRPGWDPEHQWQGLVPFEGMPQWADPDRGWIATANNRPAPDDFPYPLSGCWSDSQRAVRIRQMIEDRPKHSRDDCAAMHQDALSIRAVKCLPGLLAALQSSTDHQVQKAARLLYGWDGRMEPESTAAMVFEVFFARWTESVARERFEGEMASFLTGAASGLASALLREDVFGWLAPGRRESAIQGAMAAALHWLTEHLGPDMYQWHWGKLHVLTLRHVLSGRGDLGQLLDHGGVPVKGNFATVCNTGIGANFEAPTGATYRLIADLSASPAGLWAVDSQSESGQPGSRHYGDQLETWREGKYHFLPLDPAEAAKATQTRLMLEPGT